MSSRVLMLASVLLFFNGCDYSQKKPQTRSGPHGERLELRALPGTPAATGAASFRVSRNGLPGHSELMIEEIP